MSSLWSPLHGVLLWGEQPYPLSVPYETPNPAVYGWSKPAAVAHERNCLDFFLGPAAAYEKTASWGFWEHQEQQLARLCCAGC